MFDENFRQAGRIYSYLYIGMDMVDAIQYRLIVKRKWKQDKKFIIDSRHISWVPVRQ